jgi:methylmalonyl-CoA mutase cobalamin-binding subunit
MDIRPKVLVTKIGLDGHDAAAGSSPRICATPAWK